MSKEIKDKAKEYLRAQISIIPTKSDKTPALKEWKQYQTKRINEEDIEGFFSRAEVGGLAIICGAISGNLEVIDVDTKYDITGSLWDNLKTLIQDNLPEISNKLVIAQTKSGGYHIYYRCSSIAGNLKLAQRPTTPQEKEETYKKEKSKGAEEQTAKSRADNDKVRVLVETRGEGGYVIAPPTPNYSYIQGEPGNIPTLALGERDILFSIAKSFNELAEVKPKVSTISFSTYSSTGLNPFEDYNQRGDIVVLLKEKGWTVVSEIGERINLLRPGSTDSKTSGNYHKGLKVLRVFSSSTIFNPDRAYSPAQVFTILECSEDEEIAKKRLLELGYGDPSKVADVRSTWLKTELIKVEVVSKKTSENFVISKPGDTLKLESIKTALGEEVIITSPGSEAQEEVLKAIELCQQTTKKTYIKEGDKELRDYRYQLQSIFYKYGTIQEENGGLTDRDKDSLIEEVVIVSTNLQPIDKDIFCKEFIGYQPIQELGISEESLSITIDRLTSTRDKEAQAKEFKQLLSEVTKLQDKGEIDRALELLDNKVKEVRLQDKKTSFSKLLEIPTEEDIKLHFSHHSENLRSGFYINNEELLLPSGGLTGIAGATGHGKTDFLINLTLNSVLNYPDKEFYFFTYEMSQEAILVRFLNSYLDIDLETSSNQRAIKTYFKTGSTKYIKAEAKDFFTAKVKEFFKDIIGSGRLRVKGIDYTAPELNLALSELSKKTNVGGFFIDYFQLLKIPKEGYKNYSRQEELKGICQDLNTTAKNLQLPIILGAQFNREVTTPFKLHPTNISEAGDIERILDTLIGIWFTNKKIVAKDLTKAEENDFKNLSLDCPNKLYTYVLKSRETATDVYELLDYNGQRGKIKNSSSSGSSYFK